MGTLGKFTEKERREFAVQGIRDFWFFCKTILGIDRLREQPHKQMADEFQAFIEESEHPYALWLWPRETLKSTVITQAGTVWLLIRNPKERILITNSVLDNSMHFMGWIKYQFEANEFFRWVYGDRTTDKWYKDEIWVKGYDPQAKEPSLMISSVDKSVTSKHFTKIIADDLVDRTRVGTNERVQVTITYFQDIQDLLSYGGKMIFVGTRWAEWDLWQYILDEHSEDGDWTISIRGIIDSEGNSIFPDPEIGYPPERIERLKRTKKSEFYSQYMNAPQSSSGLTLPEPVLFHSMKEVPYGVRYMTIDPATSTKDSADDRAIVVTQQTPEDSLYVIDARNGRWSVSEFMNHIFEMFKEYRPRYLGIETSTGAQKLWLHILEEESRKRGMYLPIKELKAGNVADAKQMRILELEPYLADGRYYVRADLTTLLEQLEKWPGTRHDDVLDAAAYVMQVKRPGPWRTTKRHRKTRTYHAVSATGYW